jgi:hypothetical protein
MDGHVPGEDDSQTALLAEFDFIREGMRQDQRERLAFLGFVLAATTAVLGLLVRDSKHLPSSEQAFVLIGIALLVALVGELLTIRATVGVANAGHYIRLFIEQKVPELRFQTRNSQFVSELREGQDNRGWRGLMRASVSASSGLAIAYAVLTAGLLVVWFTLSLSTTRGFWRSAVVVSLACISGALIRQLWWTAHQGAKYVGEAWEAVSAGEG